MVIPPFVAILNPRADRGRTAALGRALEESTRGRIALGLRNTTRRGEAAELAQEAAQSGCRAVIAIGGDGTVHEVANGLMAVAAERRPPLGVIPAGSGNDFAYAVGIGKDLDRSIDVLLRGVTRSVDVGHVTTGSGRTSYCINNVGMLLEGQVNFASHQFSWPRGSGLYLRALFQTLIRPLPVAKLQLCVDGVACVRRAAILSVGNGPRSGGKFHLVPAASVDDGLFDYILAPPMSRLRLLREVHKSSRGAAHPHASFEQGRFSRLTVRSDIPIVAHVDGEPWLGPDERVDELSIDVLPNALRVLCDSAKNR